MPLMTYTVLAASGGWVAGRRYAIGAEVALDPGAVRYDVDAGAIAPTGSAPVDPPPPPTLRADDLIETLRDRRDRDVPLSALEGYLGRADGPLHQNAATAAMIFG